MAGYVIVLGTGRLYRMIRTNLPLVNVISVPWLLLLVCGRHLGRFCFGGNDVAQTRLAEV
jgi:hypothetical protein